MDERRVLFFSDHLRGPGAAAGVRSWHQVRALAKNWQVKVIIPSHDPLTTSPVTADSYSGLDHSKVEVCLAYSGRNVRTRKFLRAVYYLIGSIGHLWHGISGKKPDIVLAMSMPATMLVVAFFISRLNRVPLVVDVRDFPFDLAEELGYLRARTILRPLKALERFCLKRAGRVISVSPGYVPKLVDKGVPETRIDVLPIGYDNFEPPSDSLVRDWRKSILERFPEPKPEWLILYAGTMGYVFDVDTILDAAAALKDDPRVGFVFLGDGQRLDEYKERSRREGLRSVFLGRVNKLDVHAICHAVDVCVFPAREGEFSSALFGNKIFDYLGAGRAVVYCGPPGAVSDLLCELSAGLSGPAGDGDQLARNLMAIIADPKKRHEFEQGASKLVERGYSAQASAAKLVAILETEMTRR